jgi:hypothetical protein
MNTAIQDFLEKIAICSKTQAREIRLTLGQAISLQNEIMSKDQIITRLLKELQEAKSGPTGLEIQGGKY